MPRRSSEATLVSKCSDVCKRLPWATPSILAQGRACPNDVPTVMTCPRELLALFGSSLRATSVKQEQAASRWQRPWLNCS